MCCCGKPVVNGELGYKWQPNDAPSIRPANPPEIAEKWAGCDFILLCDEPGRCGGVDCHSHHFRLVKNGAFIQLWVRHGGGDEHFDLSCVFERMMSLATFCNLDSRTRYALLHTIYDAYRTGEAEGRDKERREWRQAPADKRIKTRKQRDGSVKVSIATKIVKAVA